MKWKKELKSKTPFIVFQFLVVKPNEHQIEDVKKLAKEIGVDDVWFKTAQVYDYENDPNNLIPTIDKYSRYRKTEQWDMSLKANWPINAGGSGMILLLPGMDWWRLVVLIKMRSISLGN